MLNWFPFTCIYNICDLIYRLKITRTSIVYPYAVHSMALIVICVCIQALLECVRLRTFGKFGLQQMQVDCHYLQVYLWKFVSDEQLVRMLLEQVMASTIERCVEHTLMGQSVSESFDVCKSVNQYL